MFLCVNTVSALDAPLCFEEGVFQYVCAHEYPPCLIIRKRIGLQVFRQFISMLSNILGCRTYSVFIHARNFHLRAASQFILTHKTIPTQKNNRKYSHNNITQSSTEKKPQSTNMNLREFIDNITPITGPVSLAESWDNVGLLVEPSPPYKIHRVMLTLDITSPILDEAIQKRVDLIYSYHPPIFQSFTKLTQSSQKEALIVKCIENKIAVFSPHTSLDVVGDGITDWLSEAIYCYKPHKTHLVMVDPVVVTPISQTDEQRKHGIGTGAGRRVEFNKIFYTMGDIVGNVKNYLQLDHLSVALGCGHSMYSEVRHAAIVCGSGGSVLKPVTQETDLFLTGEMSYHDIQATVAKGTTVITCGHGNSERGFLPVLKERFEFSLPSISFCLSENDVELLNIV